MAPIASVENVETTRRLPLIALMTATSLSLVGSLMTAIALPWFVLETTGSAAKMGITGFVESVAIVLAGILTGPIVDQYSFKRLSVISDVASGICIGCVPVLHQLLDLQFWQLLLLVFVATFVQRPGQAARQRVIPELTQQAGLRLEQTSGASEAIYHGAGLVGPLIAGVLVAWLGAANVLGIDAVTFFVSAGVVGLVIPVTGLPKPQTDGDWRYIDRLATGLRFLRRDRLLIPLTITSTLAMILITSPLFGVVLPVFSAQTSGRATSFGLMVSSFFAGALAGAAVFGAVGHRIPRRWAWTAPFLLFALPYWAMASEAPLPVILLALLVCGVAEGASNPLLVTIRFERIPVELRGRVFSALTVIVGTASPLGALLAGVVIEEIGLRSSLLILAILGQALGFAVLAVPVFRELDNVRPAQPAGEPASPDPAA